MKLIICILGLTAMALAGDDELFKQGNDKFTAKMFYEVATDNKNVGKSVVLSAYSVLPPLALLALASDGPSHDELLAAIGLPNDEVTKNVFSNLTQKMRSVQGVELNMANRLYIARDAEPKEQFAAVSRDVFDSDVLNIDFTKARSVAEINAWVESHTNNKIKDLVSPMTVNAMTRAVLVNAIYFKGTWLNQFNKLNTIPRDFHLSKEKTVKVPTMETREIFSYGESAELDAQLLELPYEGGQSSFLIVLPNKIDGLSQLQEKLKDPSLLESACGQMTRYEVDVKLPKFKIETETDLKKVLLKMNVSKMFDPQQAQLNNMLKKSTNMFISDAVQKAFIEVNEEGAEAAAANAILISKSGSILDNVTLEVNHPFYYHVQFQNIILFNGVFAQ